MVCVVCVLKIGLSLHSCGKGKVGPLLAGLHFPSRYNFNERLKGVFVILFKTRMGVFQEDTKNARKTIQNGQEGGEEESGNNEIKFL